MGQLSEFKQNLEAKKFSLAEYHQEILSRSKRLNPELNAYLEIFEHRFGKEADSGYLAGVPLGIKDIISIAGEELNASSKILKSYRASRSATVTEKLEQAGALFSGRTNCDEFAMGTSNENTPFGPVRNPWNPAFTAGGSSGGSAAAVAAGMCLGALGTDTGGSIRLPASFCGITGLKPSYGRVSRSGVVAFASSLDQVGPMAEDARDCAEILQVIAGEDARDATSFPLKVPDYVAATESFNFKGKKIGIIKEFSENESLQKEIQDRIEDLKKSFEQQGAEIKEISLPHIAYGIAVYYIVATAEASSNLSRYDGVRYGHRAEKFEDLKDLIVQSRSEGFGPEVKRRIMLGTFSLSSGYYDAYYAKAQFVRSKIQKEFLEAFNDCDLFFAPTSPTTAFKLGEKQDPLSLYLMDVFTVSVNLAGLPAISFPIGEDDKGLPMGAQFIAGPFEEEKLLGATAATEKLLSLERKIPRVG